MPWFKTFLLASLATAAPPYVQKSNVKCPITLDGRIPQNFTLKTFDTTVSPYNPGYTKGENLSWSEILLFPRVPPSRFDFDGASSSYRPIEVTINDSSIFRPGGGDLQVGFRRAGLLLGNGNDASNVGVAVYHWSNLQNRRKDWNMNLTHEYMNVWHEGNDYSHNQFSINAGVMLSQDSEFFRSLVGEEGYAWERCEGRDVKDEKLILILNRSLRRQRHQDRRFYKSSKNSLENLG